MPASVLSGLPALRPVPSLSPAVPCPPPAPPSAAELAARARLQQLAPLTSKARLQLERLQTELLRFLSSPAGITSISAVTPNHIVEFLVNREDSGSTVVHLPSCGLLAYHNPQRIRGRCPCPVRLSASSLSKLVRSLRRIFDSAGISTQWDPVTPSGNPVLSPLVSNFVAAVAKEQTLANVRAVQAPIFDESVFLHLLATILNAWQPLSDSRPFLAARAMMDAFLFSFLWYTGARTTDALRLLVQHIRPIGSVSRPGQVDWSVTVTLSKTARDPSRIFERVLRNDGSVFHPIQLWPHLVSALSDIDHGLDRGPVFLNIPSADPADLRPDDPVP